MVATSSFKVSSGIMLEGGVGKPCALPAFGAVAGLPARAFQRRPCTRMAANAAGGGLSTALESVRARISAARPAGSTGAPPMLIAVSKTKPASAVSAAYAAGQRDFGENYVQELVGKAGELPHDIRWHFIGALQANKAGALLRVPNLGCVQSVDRARVARALQRAAERENRPSLDVLVQVNVDEEGSKSGCAVDEVDALVRVVRDECDRLRFRGLMAIGKVGETRGFAVLRDTRAKVAQGLGVPAEELELSMGMSGDFEEAVRAGSTAVRVGSLIFGAREYPNRAGADSVAAADSAK